MTLEEARVLLKNLNNQVTSAFYGGDFWVEEGTFEAFEVADAALRGPEPDPDTGLVPCGCGGVARVAVQYAYPDERRVFCERCGLTTRWLSAPISVLQFHWNRAMGCREEGEG